jgi:hypothetical protein
MLGPTNEQHLQGIRHLTEDNRHTGALPGGMRNRYTTLEAASQFVETNRNGHREDDSASLDPVSRLRARR